MMRRIKRLISVNGFQFTFLYLKEAYRLVLQVIAGSPDLTYPAKGVLVKRDPYGIPTIIPLQIRVSLRSRDPSNSMAVRLTLMLLSVYRVFPTKVKPDLETIISPFSGISPTLPQTEIEHVVKRFVRGKVAFGPYRGFISESAGPNMNVATWSSGIDALAFIWYPKQLLYFLKIGFITRSYGYSCWLLLLLLMFGPFYLVSYMVGYGSRLTLGKLGVVYDQAGKARVVAITNWWIQLALKPLHESIFRFLKRVPQDGTFDQPAPLDLLLKTSNDSKFHSYDLSAATDRLPLSLQRQVLHSLGVRDDLWAGLLDFPWYFRQRAVKYAVGQPMGAYSSWAMLALTHHVLVRVCALRVGRDPGTFSDYAVLGDDIAIKDDDVASEYLRLMAYLGVKISFNKSLVSKDTIEFAKRVISTEGDLTPIGPGNILQASRHKESVAMFVTECVRLGYTPFRNTVLELLRSLPKKYKGEIPVALQVCFGLTGALNQRGQTDPYSGIVWCSHGEWTPDLLRYSFYEGTMSLLLEKYREAIKQAQEDETYFYRNWWKKARTSGPLAGFLVNLLILSSPAFWLYALALIKAREESESTLKSFLALRLSGTWQEIRELTLREPLLHPTSLDWRDRRSAKAAYKSLLRLEELIHRTKDQMYVFPGEDGVY